MLKSCSLKRTIFGYTSQSNSESADSVHENDSFMNHWFSSPILWLTGTGIQNLSQKAYKNVSGELNNDNHFHFVFDKLFFLNTKSNSNISESPSAATQHLLCFLLKLGEHTFGFGSHELKKRPVAALPNPFRW